MQEKIYLIEYRFFISVYLEVFSGFFFPAKIGSAIRAPIISISEIFRALPARFSKFTHILIITPLLHPEP